MSDQDDDNKLIDLEDLDDNILNDEKKRKRRRRKKI